MRDLRQSDGWACFLKSLGWVIEEVEKEKIFIKKIPLLGSAMKIQRPTQLPNLSQIEALAQKYQARIIYFEPSLGLTQEEKALLTKFGFEKYPYAFTYGKTVLVEIGKTPEEIQKNFSQDARYSIRKAEKLGVKVEFGNLSEFYRIFKETGRAKHFWVPSFSELEKKLKCFDKKAFLLTAYQDNTAKPLAGALFLLHDKTLYYHHAASSEEGRKLFAPYPLLWQGILEGKRRGAKVLNLEGIYDERLPKFAKPWRAFSVFKQKWGGEVRAYPETLVKYNHSLLKMLFKLTDFFI